MDVIAKKLSLSPDQIAKIKPLLSDQLERTFAAREKFAASDHSDAAKKEAMESIEQSRSATRDQVQSILSPDQLKKSSRCFSTRVSAKFRCDILWRSRRPKYGR